MVAEAAPKGRAKPGPDRPSGRAVSITVTLAVSIGLLVLVSVSTVLWIGLSTSRRNTLDLLNEQSTMIVETIETAIRNHLEPASHQLDHLSRLVDAGQLDPTDPDRMADLMLGSTATAPQLMATVYWDSDLQQIVAARLPNGRLLIEQNDHSDNPVAQSVLEGVRDASGPFWGEPVYDDGIGETFVNLRTPLRRDGVIFGVLGTAVGMQELSFLMVEIGFLFDATAFIMHGEDRVLAHPHLTVGHADLSEDTPVVSLTRIDDPPLERLAAREAVPGFDTAAAAGVEVSTVAVNRREHVIFTKRIDGYSDRDWLIGAHVPAQQVDAELRRLANAAGAGLVALLVAIIAAVALGRAIARPVRRLAAGAARIADLNLANVPALPPSHIRELNDQATSFNAMLAGLRWFETYVPRTLVSRLMRRGEADPALSQERELTVMFTDIVGFTTLSETMSATETAELLNAHFAIIGAAVEATEGTIDKFIGDAVMAFWGAPDPQPDHAARACRTALTVADALANENAARTQAGFPPVRVRIGIHTGPVVVGNIGAPGRINYTIVGDTVNTGQRIEALNKELEDTAADAAILVSGTTAAALDDQFNRAPAGAFQLRGKSSPVDVWRLTGPRRPRKSEAE